MPLCGLLLLPWALLAAEPVVEVEEDVYAYVPPSNGAGPMWCSGSACIVRAGGTVFVSGTETLDEVPPLNNVRWTLWARGDNGWRLLHRDDEGLTREPSPLASLGDGRLLLSANPTLNPPGTPGGGPAEPQVLRFDVRHPRGSPESMPPVWIGEPAFTEHSYRSFASDAARHEAFLLQNVGYEHAEWSFLEGRGEWTHQGRLVWPVVGAHDAAYSLRLCYPNVAVRDRSVYFCGVSDIIEPNPEWRAFKQDLTGQDWDYDFRRLFYAWCPDVATGEFTPWVEVASRDDTCGWISPGDLWVAEDGRVHLLWTERAIDERLRERFFPEAKQRYSLEYAVVEGTQVVERRTLVEGGDGLGGVVPGLARFHGTPSGELYVLCYIGGTRPDGGAQSENWLLRLNRDGAVSERWVVPFDHPFSSFFVAGPRNGSEPSDVLDILGESPDLPNTVRYARVRAPDTGNG